MKKSQNIKALQEANLVKYFKATKSQAILLMKKFHRVQSLGLLWDFHDIQIQKETRRWLKYTKKLRSLVFRHVGIKTRPSSGTESNMLNRKLLQDIKQRRIIRLVHSPAPYDIEGNDYILDMRYYPSSLQEISFGLVHCAIKPGEHLETLFSMKKLYLLTKLELFCLELNPLLVVLRSMPNPQLLTSFGLLLKNNFEGSDEEYFDFIFDFIMNKCPGLDKLDLRITHPTEKLKDLNLQDRLQALNLWISVKKEGHLEDLRLFLLNHKNLKNLDLKINFDLNSKLSKENLCEFYQVISQLTHLKRLRLNFSPREETFFPSSFIKYFKIPPSYPALMASIACLNNLEELCLCIPDEESGLQANQLGKAFEKIACQLKKLEVSFYGQALEGTKEFLDLLRNMTEIRELYISRFSVTQESSFCDFQEILKNCKNLERIVLDQFWIPSEEDETMRNFVLSISEKRGLKELIIRHLSREINGKIKAGIIFPEIVKKRNLGLRSVRIHSPNFSPAQEPFGNLKYNNNNT